MSSEEPSRLLETADLLTRARAGDAAAREDLFRRYTAPLERFLHARLPESARSAADTMDLVQEVSIRAYSSLDRFEYRGVGSFWAYLRRIGLRYVKDVSAKSGHGPASAGPLADDSQGAPAAKVPSPADALLTRESLSAFEKALESLSSKQRESVLLRIELGASFEVIAADCGYPSADAARMAVARALERMAREVGGGGGESGD